MRKIGTDEVKQIELDLLIRLDEICKKNNLRYYLCGGTLLGAVRHKGFIPWDDDIDVLMPRDDFQKLLELPDEKNDEVKKISWKNGESIYPFIKLVNTKTAIKEKYLDKEVLTSVWIDIFPLDGMPDSDRKIKKKFRRIKFYKTLLLTAYSEIGTGATWYSTALKYILIPICRRLNTVKLCDKLNRISSEYDINTSPYVGGFLWGYGPQEKMPKSFLEPCEVTFEGKKFRAPSCWDYYLKSLYGDYMKLPPEEKRKGHQFDVWWKE